MILCYFVTADPPTIGHRGVVLYGLSKISGVTEVRIIPPREHVWGKTAVDFEHRVQMLRLAMQGIDPRIHISSAENNAALSGYSVDTLRMFATNEPEAQFGVLVGSDTIDTFHKWKDWEQIVSMATVYVCPRGSLVQAKHEQNLPDEVRMFVGSRILFLSDPDTAEYPLHISSTDARAELARNGVTDKVSSDVMNYIQSHALYGV